MQAIGKILFYCTPLNTTTVDMTECAKELFDVYGKEFDVLEAWKTFYDEAVKFLVEDGTKEEIISLILSVNETESENVTEGVDTEDGVTVLPEDETIDEGFNAPEIDELSLRELFIETYNQFVHPCEKLKAYVISTDTNVMDAYCIKKNDALSALFEVYTDEEASEKMSKE